MVYKNISCLRIFFLTVCICLMTSCVLSPRAFRAVKYHDLGNPEMINPNGPYVDFSRLILNGPYKTKMVFRAKNNELVINEYHKWAQIPDALLGRYLALAFRGKPESDNIKSHSVKGTILAFEADEETSKAVLMIEYTIVEPSQGKKKSFSKTFTVDMKEKKPGDFATAMSEIAANLAKQLKKDMQEY